jgi:hypothetical protein
VRLRGVFEHLQPVPRGELANRVDVRRLSVEMHGQNRFRAWRDGGLDALGIEVVRARIRLHRHGRGAGVADRQPGRDVGVGRDDHLVARADVPRAEHEVHRIETVADAHAVFHADEGGELALEGAHLVTEDVPAAVEDALDRFVDRSGQLAIRRFHVEERNGHRFSSWRRYATKSS